MIDSVVARFQIVRRCLDCVNLISSSKEGIQECYLEPDHKVVSNPSQVADFCRMPVIILGCRDAKEPA
jgi:hypothetical protein